MSRVIVDSLIATAFAPVCVSCAQVLETPTRSPACDRCWQNLRHYTPPWCSRCGAPLARADAPHECLPAGSAVRALRALGPYEGVLRDLLHALKFDRRRSLAAPLGSRLQSSADELFEGADALVPVPLHPWRQWRRGFNQAADLAIALRANGRPIWPAVRRRRSTRPQFELDADRRHANVRAAFAIGGWTPWQRARWARTHRRAYAGPGGRCDHDWRDARSVRRGAPGAWRTGGARGHDWEGGARSRSYVGPSFSSGTCLQYAAVRVCSKGRTSVRPRPRPELKSGPTGSSRPDRESAPQSRPSAARRIPAPSPAAAPGGDSSRALAPAAAGRARSDRVRPACARPRSRARCRGRSSGRAAAGSCCVVGQPACVEPL